MEGACTRDQHVQPSRTGDRLLHDPRRVLGPRHVGDDRMPADLVGRGREQLGVQVDEDDRRSLCGEHARTGAPDSARRSGHDCRLPAEPEVHLSGVVGGG